MKYLNEFCHRLMIVGLAIILLGGIVISISEGNKRGETEVQVKCWDQKRLHMDGIRREDINQIGIKPWELADPMAELDALLDGPASANKQPWTPPDADILHQLTPQTVQRLYDKCLTETPSVFNVKEMLGVLMVTGITLISFLCMCLGIRFIFTGKIRYRRNDVL